MPKTYVKVDYETINGSGIRPVKIYWPDGKSWDIIRTLIASESDLGEFEGIR